MVGLIDIKAGSLAVQAFAYPDISDDEIDKGIECKKTMLIESFKAGKGGKHAKNKKAVD